MCLIRDIVNNKYKTTEENKIEVDLHIKSTLMQHTDAFPFLGGGGANDVKAMPELPAVAYASYNIEYTTSSTGLHKASTQSSITLIFK